MWFKEDPPPLAFDPALTGPVARVRRESAPEVVAADGVRMLTRDCGPWNAVCRILLWQRVLEPLPLEAAAPHGDPIAGWREILRGLVEGTIVLGEA